MSYTINGQSQDIPDPVVRDGVTYLPLAKVVETLGGYLTWLNASKTVSVEMGDLTVEVKEGSARVEKDSGIVSLAGETFNDSGTLWVASNFFTDVLGCTVDVSGNDVTVSASA